jgi:gas vesicle protein
MKPAVQAINRFLFGAITAAAAATTATVGASDTDSNHLRRTVRAVSASTSDHDGRRLADRVTDDEDSNSNSNNINGNGNGKTITRRFQQKQEEEYEDSGAALLLSNTTADSANDNISPKKCHPTDLGSLVSCPKKGESCRPLLVMHDEQQKDGGYDDEENTNTNWYCMSDDESTIGITTMMMATTMEDEEDAIMMDEMKVSNVILYHIKERVGRVRVPSQI